MTPLAWPQPSPVSSASHSSDILAWWLFARRFFTTHARVPQSCRREADYFYINYVAGGIHYLLAPFLMPPPQSSMSLRFHEGKLVLTVLPK